MVIAACGSSGSTGAGSGQSAKTLLSETFTGSHPVNSGVLKAALSLTPTGSSLISGPITISFGGPFQNRGKQQLPASNFTASIGVAGHTGALTFLSTGTAGFVELSGVAYKLPASNFKQLESGFSSVTGSGGASGASLKRLGIDPQRWIANPTVVGTADVGGTATEHLRGAVAVGPLLSDLSSLLAKAPSVSAEGQSVPKSISPATQAKITSAVKDASVDIWTGSSDHTLRKITVSARVPITATSSALGGLKSLGISFTLSYTDVGQSQTITAPSSSQPYSVFQTKLSELVGEIEQLVVSAESSAGGSTSSGG